MTRDLKVLGLSLLAVAAVGAVGAQGALGAVEHEFHSDGERTTITGKNVGTSKFAFGSAGTIECTSVTTKGTLAGTQVSAETYKSDTLTLVPTYTGCTFGGQPATVNFNHCALVFDSDTTTGNPTGGEHANVEKECSGGTEIEIDTSVCTITIAPQLIKHAVRFQNDPSSSSAFEIITTAHKVKTGKKKTTESQTGCLLFPTGEIGTFAATYTNECFKDEGEKHEGTAATTPSITHGATTKCTVTNV